MQRRHKLISGVMWRRHRGVAENIGENGAISINGSVSNVAAKLASNGGVAKAINQHSGVRRCMYICGVIVGIA